VLPAAVLRVLLPTRVGLLVDVAVLTRIEIARAALHDRRTPFAGRTHGHAARTARRVELRTAGGASPNRVGIDGLAAARREAALTVCSGRGVLAIDRAATAFRSGDRRRTAGEVVIPGDRCGAPIGARDRP